MRRGKEVLVFDRGREAGRRHPMLLALVYGVFLVLVGITASALVAVASVHVSSATLAVVVSRDRSLIDLFVNDTLRVSDLAAAGPSPSRANELEAKLAALTAKDEILRVELRRPDGTIVVSDAAGLRGRRPPTSAGMQRALAGEPSANLLEASQVSDPAGPPIVAESVVQEICRSSGAMVNPSRWSPCGGTPRRSSPISTPRAATSCSSRWRPARCWP